MLKILDEDVMAANEYSETLSADVYWRDFALTGRVFCEKLEGYLRSSRTILGAEVQYYLIEGSGRKTECIDSDFLGLQQQLGAELSKQWAFVNSDDPDSKAFSDNATSRSGFVCSFSTGPIDDPSPIVFSISAGGTDNDVAHVSVRFWADPSYQKLLELFKETIHWWGAERGLVTRGVHQRALSQPKNEFGVGWITYLPFGGANWTTPADARVQRFESGLLVEAGDAIPSADDANALRGLSRMREFLKKSGLLDRERV